MAEKLYLKSDTKAQLIERLEVIAGQLKDARKTVADQHTLLIKAKTRIAQMDLPVDLGPPIKPKAKSIRPIRFYTVLGKGRKPIDGGKFPVNQLKEAQAFCKAKSAELSYSCILHSAR
jgi:hypothetical protein